VFKALRFKSSGEIYIRLLFNKIIEFEKKMSKFDIRKILKRVSDANIGYLLEKQNVAEPIFDAEDDEEIHEEEIDDDADDKNNEIEHNIPDIFSINDVDIEDDLDNNYVDLGDRQN
jgi:hypothetical protein